MESNPSSIYIGDLVIGKKFQNIDLGKIVGALEGRVVKIYRRGMIGPKMQLCTVSYENREYMTYIEDINLLKRDPKNIERIESNSLILPENVVTVIDKNHERYGLDYMLVESVFEKDNSLYCELFQISQTKEEKRFRKDLNSRIQEEINVMLGSELEFEKFKRLAYEKGLAEQYNDINFPDFLKNHFEEYISRKIRKKIRKIPSNNTRLINYETLRRFVIELDKIRKLTQKEIDGVVPINQSNS